MSADTSFKEKSYASAVQLRTAHSLICEENCRFERLPKQNLYDTVPAGSGFRPEAALGSAVTRIRMLHGLLG